MLHIITIKRRSLTLVATLLLLGSLAVLGWQWASSTADADSPPDDSTSVLGTPTPDVPLRDNDVPWCDERGPINTNQQHSGPPTAAPTAPPAPIPGSGQVAGATAACKARPTITPSTLGSPARFRAMAERMGYVFEDPTEPSSEGPLAYNPAEVVRHVGAEVIDDHLLMIIGNIEVTNPSVPHDNEDGDDHQFVARFAATKEVTGIDCPTIGDEELCWIEVGWGEFESQGDARYVYTYSTDDPTTYTYQNYPLVDGETYHFHIKYVGEDPPLWAAYFWWAPDQESVCLPHPDGDCERPVGFDYAYVAEQFAEVGTTNATGDFAIRNTEFGSDDSSGRIQLQIGPGTEMQDWLEDDFPDTVEHNNDGDYSVTWDERYDNWSADD